MTETKQKFGLENVQNSEKIIISSRRRQDMLKLEGKKFELAWMNYKIENKWETIRY